MSGFEQGPVEPVGRSFEVRGASPDMAVRNARAKAAEASVGVGRVLWLDQIEAGVYEVVLEEKVESEAMRFFRWLIDNSDTFDPVAVRIALEDGMLRPDEEQMQSLVDAFAAFERAAQDHDIEAGYLASR